MTIRVLHIIGNLKLGGAQICVKQLVEHNADPSIIHYIYPLRSRSITIPVKGTVIDLPFSNYDIRKFFAILKICRTHRIDIVHAHLHKAILGALLASFFCTAKVVIHEHGPIFRRGIQYSFYRLMLRLLKKRASAVIANSQTTARQLTRKCKIQRPSIDVIYNAVDVNAFQKNPEKRTQARRQFGFSDVDIVIGYVGRLHHVKGVDLLVQAMPLIVQKVPHAKLLLVGDGPLLDSLKKQVLGDNTAPFIRFAGFQENVSDIMNAFDIGCIPSRQEAFGIVALEMMAMKIPLVSSAPEGLAEIVKHEQNALIPNETAPSQLCECIVRLIHDRDLQAALTHSAFETVRQFDISHMAAQINDLYRRVNDSPAVQQSNGRKD